MHQFLIFSVTARFCHSPWRHDTPLFDHFCHREVIQQPLVRTCTTLWSFLPPRGPPAANGDSMRHFLIFFVAAKVIQQPIVATCTTFGHFYHREFLQQLIVRECTSFFCHRKVLQLPMVTVCTNFWSFLSPQGLAADYGDNIHHYLVISVAVRSSSSPW